MDSTVADPGEPPLPPPPAARPQTPPHKDNGSSPLATSSLPPPYVEDGDSPHVASPPSEEEHEGQDQTLSHQEALAHFKDGMAELIVGDDLLNDLPLHITLEEVNSLISLEYGQSMTVRVCQADGQAMAVVVHQNATVLDLKHAIKRHVTLQQMRQNAPTLISWRYIWRSFWLYHEGQKLTEDHKPLKEYDIRNKAEVTFIKRLKQK